MKIIDQIIEHNTEDNSTQNSEENVQNEQDAQKVPRIKFLEDNPASTLFVLSWEKFSGHIVNYFRNLRQQGAQQFFSKSSKFAAIFNKYLVFENRAKVLLRENKLEGEMSNLISSFENLFAVKLTNFL